MEIGFSIARRCLVLAAVILIAQVLSAQYMPTSKIVGTVGDTSGAVVPMATVNLTSGRTRVATTKTDGFGRFRFDVLQGGDYDITVECSGFQKTVVHTRASPSQEAALSVVVEVAAKNEQVSVTADSSVPQVSTESADNQNTNTITAGTLDRVPVFDQDYIATISRFLDESTIGTNGVTFIVNGVEANGPGVSAAAIQEVKINQNPYSALYGRPGRARIEITTKNGSEQFHGSLNFQFRDAMFDARNPFAAVKPSDQRRYYEALLTGPLGKGKNTTFLLSLERDEEDQEAIVVADMPNGAVNENVPQPTRHSFFSGRLFHNFTPNDQFWIGYSYELTTNKNSGVGGTVLPEAGTHNRFFEHEINVGHTHVFSPSLINQLHFLVGHYDRPTFSNSTAPKIVVSDTFVTGGAQADQRRTEYHFDGTDVVSYAAGKHSVKFGVDVPDISRRGLDDFTNSAGTYLFGSMSSYLAGTASTYTLQRGNGHLVFLEKVVAGFIEDSVRWKPNLTLSVGLRHYWQNYFHDVAHDFAPRVGFAYAPTANSKSIIRGGAGLFYDRTGPIPISDLLRFNGTQLQRFIVSNPTYPVSPTMLDATPTSIVELDPGARMPYTVQYSLGFERQISPAATLSATYVGSRGIDMWRSRDVNAPPPPSYLNRPDPRYGQIRQMESGGYQKSNALEVTFRRRASKYFSGQAQYTLSKTCNNTGSISYFPESSYFPAADWARSDNDRRHKFDLLGSSDIRNLFTFGFGISVYSGKPVNELTGSDDNHDGNANDRPIGTPRNTIHGPGYTSVDLSLRHEFLLTKNKKEGPSIIAALDGFNVLNHTNNITYAGTITSPFFGRAVAAEPARRLQLNLQVKF
jgi:hypothetical protein